MAAPLSSSFDDWLSDKLLSLNPDVDLDVFVSYIHGILDTEDESGDKLESISGLLGAIVEEEETLTDECNTIMKKWIEILSEETKTVADTLSTDFSQQVASIIELQQVQSTKTQRAVTKEERQHKAAILAQFDVISDGETSGGDEAQPDISDQGKDGALVRNMNALSMDQRVREEREFMKCEHDQRRHREKQQVVEQKAKVAERKESEKKRTQKGEKRR